MPVLQGSQRHARPLRRDELVARVESPARPEGQRGELFALDADGSDDVWAVGDRFTKHPGPLAEHFDGTSWSLVPAQGVPSSVGRTELRSVAVLGPGDVWASGDSVLPIGGGDTYDELAVEHFDDDGGSLGDAPSPKLTHPYSSVDLWGIAATGDGSALAVGSYGPSSLGQGFGEQWDGSTWALVPMRTPVITSTNLTGVSAVSTTDVWAVGQTGWARTSAFAEHWDGSAWTRSPLAPDVRHSRLEAVDARATDDVWAVGTRAKFGIDAHPLIEHWDGAGWSLTDAPDIGKAQDLTLESVSADAPADAWICGDYGSHETDVEFVWRWDGQSWTSMPYPTLPSGATSGGLTSISAASPDDVWAVGVYQRGDGIERPFAAQWNGSAWTLATSGPYAPGAPRGELTSVSAADASTATSVGTALVGSRFEAVAASWDGTTWTQQQVPGPEPEPTATDVDTLDPSDSWLAGSSQTTAFVDRWDGSTWSSVPGLNTGHTLLQLGGIAATSGSDAWVVGSYQAANGSVQPAMAHWDGQGWRWAAR